MADNRSMKTESFWKDESGVGVIEMVLIVVVLIALVLIFRDRLTSLLETIMGQIEDSATSVYGGPTSGE